MYVYEHFSQNSSQNEKNCFSKSCRDNQSTFMFSIDFPENRDVYEIIWGKKKVESDRPQMSL